MFTYYKCQSKSIYTEVSEGEAEQTTVTEVLAPAGTRACLRNFYGFAAAAAYRNTSISASAAAKMVSVEFKLTGTDTVLLETLLPVHTTSDLARLGSVNGGFGLLGIPGPGILFDRGLEVKVVIPANPNTGIYIGGPIMSVLNVVYSS